MAPISFLFRHVVGLSSHSLLLQDQYTAVGVSFPLPQGCMRGTFFSKFARYACTKIVTTFSFLFCTAGPCGRFYICTSSVSRKMYNASHCRTLRGWALPFEVCRQVLQFFMASVPISPMPWLSILPAGVLLTLAVYRNVNVYTS